MPYAVFATPELGRIGLSETEARELAYEARQKMLNWTSKGR